MKGLIKKFLLDENYIVEDAETYTSAQDKIVSYEYDCILLDIILPDRNGLRLLQELKNLGKTNDDQFGWFFEDNYFDLLPGEKKVVQMFGKHSNSLITAKPFFSKYSTSIVWQKV